MTREEIDLEYLPWSDRVGVENEIRCDVCDQLADHYCSDGSARCVRCIPGVMPTK